MKKVISFLVVVFVALLEATPVVSNVKVTQSEARIVTVQYELANAPAVVTMNVQTNSGDGVWVDIGGENVWSQSQGGVWSPAGDVFKRVENDGAHTFTWRPDRSWPDHKFDAGAVRIVLTAWAIEDAPDYLSVELKAEGDVGYYQTADYVRGGVLSNLAYRTTTLLLRRIHARGIPWTMGNAVETDRRADREDPHTVVLTNDYYIGVFEVTQRQWALGGGGERVDIVDVHDMRPITYVAYNNIRDMKNTANYWPNDPDPVSWLGKTRALTGIDFDLPSEAQWEFACRAGTNEGYWNTGARYGTVTVYPGRYTLNRGEETTAICGSYAPSRWGIYDMHGNVLEWCLDWGRFDIGDLYGAVNTEQDSSIGNYRVVRGGGWNNVSSYMRSSFRAWNLEDLMVKDYGFRVVCRAGLK